MASYRFPLLLFFFSKCILLVLFVFGRGLFDFHYDHYNETFVSQRLSGREIQEQHVAGSIPLHLTPYDAQWYVHIAREGYNPEALTSGEKNIVFFPLYPLLIAIGAPFLGGYAWAGIMLSSFFQLLWMCVLYRLVEKEYSASAARTVLWLMILFPMSIFYHAVYTESLFLFLTVLTVFFARQHVWWGSALAAFFASLTKFQGVLLFPVLVLELYLQKREEGAWSWKRLLPLFVAPLGPVVYFSYLQWLTGDFWAAMKAQQSFGLGRVVGWHPEYLWDQITHLTLWHSFKNSSIDLLLLVSALLLTVMMIRKIRPTYTLYAALGILMPLSTWSLMSMGRYVMILFPLFLYGALLLQEKEDIKTLFFVLFAGFSAIFTIMFFNWHWVG